MNRRRCGSLNTNDGNPCRNLRQSCPYPSHKQARPKQVATSIDLPSFSTENVFPADQFAVGFDPDLLGIEEGSPDLVGIEEGSPGLAGQPKQFIQILKRTIEYTGQEPRQITKEYWLLSSLYGIATESEDEYIRHPVTGLVLGKFVFGGGSSLMAGWDIVQRHSEDVDIIVFAAEHKVSAKNVGRLLKMSLQAGVDYLEPVTQHVEKDVMVVKCYRSMMFDIGTAKEYLKIESTLESPEQGLKLAEPRVLMSNMGKCASPEQLAEFPELGGFRMQCITPEYTALNKFDALHRRALMDMHESIFDRGRDGYDLACIAQTEHGLYVQKLLDASETRDARPLSTRPKIARPAQGYSASPVFMPGTQAYLALEEGYHFALEEMVWGEAPSFKDAVMLIKTLDQR